MTRYRNRLLIAALLAGASVLAPTRAAIAQGALETRAREIAPAPAAEPALQPARSVLHQLTGTRVATALYDDLRLEWTETHDDSSHSQGVLGFDPRVSRFYSSAVYSDGSGVQLLTGAPSPAEPLILFTPLPVPQPDRRPMESFTLTVIDPDHFTWVPLDRGWRAVFTREP